MRKVGKGRLRYAKEDQPDPYDTVADIQNIMSHRTDILRLYNAPSSNFLYETTAQGKQGVITCEFTRGGRGATGLCFCQGAA